MPGFPAVDPNTCADRVSQWLRWTILAEQDGDLLGILILDRTSWWWSKDEFIGDRVLFIRPDARNSDICRQFFTIAKKLAASQGLPLIMATINGVEVERKDKLYQRMGFKRMGGTYAWGLKP